MQFGVVVAGAFGHAATLAGSGAQVVRGTSGVSRVFVT
jgi:hypothetical protein